MKKDTDQVSHSPLPWRVVRERLLIGDGEDVIGIAGADGLVIDDAYLPDADAAFIVTACNAHHDLLAALKALLGECEHAGIVEIPFSFDIRAIADARAAIAKAEQK